MLNKLTPLLHTLQIAVKTQLVHINLMKPCVSQEPKDTSEPVPLTHISRIGKEPGTGSSEVLPDLSASPLASPCLLIHISRIGKEPGIGSSKDLPFPGLHPVF